MSLLDQDCPVTLSRPQSGTWSQTVLRWTKALASHGHLKIRIPGPSVTSLRGWTAIFQLRGLSSSPALLSPSSSLFPLSSPSSPAPLPFPPSFPLLSPAVAPSSSPSSSFTFAVLGFKPRASCPLDQCPTTAELQPSPDSEVLRPSPRFWPEVLRAAWSEPPRMTALLFLPQAAHLCEDSCGTRGAGRRQMNPLTETFRASSVWLFPGPSDSPLGYARYLTDTFCQLLGVAFLHVPLQRRACGQRCGSLPRRTWALTPGPHSVLAWLLGACFWNVLWRAEDGEVVQPPSGAPFGATSSSLPSF